MKLRAAAVTLSLLMPFWLRGAPLTEHRIGVCADDAQWPPFSYSTQPGLVEGLTVDLLHHAFSPLGIPTGITQLPWRRCLAAAAAGTLYQIAVDASANPQRERSFLLTRPYYELSPFFFYSRRQHPQGIEIEQGQDLKRYGSVCGLPGYNYENFALGPTEIYRGAKDFYALAEMTHRGRCALFIGRYEIVAGLTYIGPDLLRDPDLAYQPIPDALPEPFHLLISRNAPHARYLKRILDETIERMTRDGRLEQLKRRYLGAPPERSRTGSSR